MTVINKDTTVLADSDGPFRQFQIAMNSYPPLFRGNCLNLLLISDAQSIGDSTEYLKLLDSPLLCEERREYLVAEHARWPFPAYNIPSRPDPRLLSMCLCDRFDVVPNLLYCQRDIGRILADRSRWNKPDIVALMIVDGLSYYDLPEMPDLYPCFVNGVSITEFGHREVVGKPSVAERLFSIGYHQQTGFSYFDVSTNTLASELYSVFGNGQVSKVKAFEDCLEQLKLKKLSHGYVQIVAPGLDHLCHDHRDRPPTEYYIQRILGWFEVLLDCLRKGNRTVLACLTADHGILWRKHVEEEWIYTEDLQPEDLRHVRYISGSRLRSYANVRQCYGDAYTILKYPYITRKLRNTEWGVHGGISAWESLVPLIIREIQ